MQNDTDKTSEEPKTEEINSSDKDTSKEGEQVSGTGEDNAEGTKSSQSGSSEEKDTHISGQKSESESGRRGSNRGQNGPRRPSKLQTGHAKSNKGSGGGSTKQSDKTEQQPARHSFLFQRGRQAKETNKS